MLLLTPMIAGNSQEEYQWLALRVWWHALAFITHEITWRRASVALLSYYGKIDAICRRNRHSYVIMYYNHKNWILFQCRSSYFVCMYVCNDNHTSHNWLKSLSLKPIIWRWPSDTKIFFNHMPSTWMAIIIFSEKETRLIPSLCVVINYAFCHNHIRLQCFLPHITEYGNG